jgi:hypothetical protein
MLSRIFLLAIEIRESLRSYQEYPAKSVGKQGEEFLKPVHVKSLQDSFIRNLFQLVQLFPKQQSEIRSVESEQF